MLIVTGIAYLFREPLDGRWFVVLPKEDGERVPVGCKEHARDLVKLLEEGHDISKEEIMSLNQQISDSDLPEIWRSPLEATAFFARATSDFAERVLLSSRARQETLH